MDKSNVDRPAKHNLIIFLPDQQRADTIVCYGGVNAYAPNLSKLAAKSIVFDRVYVTQPVCSPSRSSLMTGLWPHTTGCTQNGSAIHPRFRLFPELMRDQGYKTAYMGKWHLRPAEMFERAFQKRVTTQGAGDYSEFLVGHGLSPDRKEGGFAELTISNLPVELSQPKFLEEQACEFIRQQSDQPFILVVAFVEPHTPYNGPLNDEHLLNDIALDLSAERSLPDDTPLRYRLIREWQQEQALSDPEKREFYFGITLPEYRRLKQKYLGLVTLVDRSIGAILDCVEQAGLEDRTIIVHTSDHGDMLGAHQLFGKEVMFEEAVRVPYSIRFPGREAARISRAVSHIDFVPTLLDLLDQPQAPQCAGKSLAPLIRGEELAEESVFVEWSPNWRTKIKNDTSLGSRREIKRAVAESTRTVISSAGWRLSLRNSDLNELYDLNSDPNELHNLYYDSQYRPMISRYAREIRLWQKNTRDKCRLPKV